MTRFNAIEGLRAWLAWSVVVAHLIHMFAAEEIIHPLLKVQRLGDHAVSIFIIISGFVITNLLIEKREPYGQYIYRRFLRIYPAYIVCLVVGIVATYLTFDVMLRQPWGELTPPTARMQEQYSSLHEQYGFAKHMLAHLTMLHGAVSTDALFESQYMFLGPAWSLSLEWQFYLIAPFVLFACRSHIGSIGIAAVSLVGLIAYQKGWLGSFRLPSFLPGAALYFATGILTRLAWPRLSPFAVYPTAPVIILFAFYRFNDNLLPFAAWFAFVAYMLLEKPADRISRTVKRVADLMFLSAPARYLGERSYSTYLIHVPVIQLITFCGIRYFGFGMWQTMALSCLIAPPVTLLSSVVIYKFIEHPAIQFGRRTSLSKNLQP